jgi:hypothetical protein
MKNIILLLVLMISCKSFPQSNCSQYTILPLRTYTDIPEDQCYYLKDTNNELQAFVGTWKGTWNGKTIFITFKKITNKYNDTLKYNTDIIIGKFKTIDSNGNILFDNSTLSDDQSKIRGGNYQNVTNKYLMSYRDKDICRMNGTIYLTFANIAKTQLNFSFQQYNQVLTSDCYFHGWPEADRPEPLPKSNIILTKQ